MSRLSDFARDRVKVGLDRRGKRIIYRRITTSGGPSPALNPPVFTAPIKVNGNFLAGVSSISLLATYLVGRVVAGDQFTIGSKTYTVTNTVSASSNGLAGVGINPVLAADVADLTTVTFSFLNDTTLYASVRSFPRNLMDGTLVTASDLMVLIPAKSLPFTPKNTDRLIIDDVQKDIVDYTPGYQGDQVAFWNVHAR